ncbi:plant expansin [Heliocybe sulcata]|uniref:Plant expansin n=1 Tax=Heliocybe sulcata TaxID=5364 RepID=A0A5C3N0B7_9AGAM|nr:plant expansin [Heliocybe sulcata]
MYTPSISFFAFFALLFSLAQAATIHWNQTEVESGLTKRVDNAKFTWFDVGLGACGHNNVASDYVVALSLADFGAGYPGPNCGRKLQISYGGKTATAEVVDKCPGCPQGGLDLSNGLFAFFDNPAIEVIYGSWNYI